MGRAFETLVLLMARVRILQRALRREERTLERKGKTRKLQLADGWPTITFFNLYLASVHVLIEAWDDGLFHDDHVYDLLKRGDRSTLRRFRNGVFHAGPYNSDKLIAIYRKHREAQDWADRLLDAVTAFVKRELARRHVAAIPRVPAQKRG